MCEPTTIAYIGMAVVLAAGAVEADSQRKAGRANAQIEANNAQMAKQQGKDEQLLAVRQQQEAAWRTRALLGKQKTQAAANNLDMDVGTPLDIMGETAMFGQAEEDAIGINAARKAWGFEGEATNAYNRGRLSKWQGDTQANITIMKSIGQAMSMYGGMAGNSGSATRAAATKTGGGVYSTGAGVGGYISNPYATRG